MVIESGFPFILESERQGEDDYSIKDGGRGNVLVWYVDIWFDMQEGCREGRVVTEPVTLRGKLRPSKGFSSRTVINVDLVQREISYLVELSN